MKILFLDIETSPNTAYVWGIFKENIPLARLIDTSDLLCWSAKWFDEEEVIFYSNARKKEMLKVIHSMLSEADMVVTYNGNRFDLPILNKEFLLADMPPPAPYKSLDIYQTIKQRFRFTSNKLDHIAQQLGKGQKHETSFQLWVDCMNDDPEAWEKMSEYNIQDVLLLEKLYEKLLPWINNHANHQVYSGVSSVCPRCGSERSQSRGYAYTAAGKYRRRQCKDCSGWFREGLRIKDIEALTRTNAI